MKHQTTPPSGRQAHFADDEIIVTKTDARGFITYANAVFERVSGYNENEAIGKPHNIVRHPDMPMCVFRLLWETIEAGQEIFAYVINQAKNGDHYWVLAHVTPTRDGEGRIVGYHSNRRTATPEAVKAISGIYSELRRVEQQYENASEATEAGLIHLRAALAKAGKSYGEFVFSLDPVYA